MGVTRTMHYSWNGRVNCHILFKNGVINWWFASMRCGTQAANIWKVTWKGGNSWSTQNTILGWFVDTVAILISLPTHHQEISLPLGGNHSTQTAEMGGVWFPPVDQQQMVLHKYLYYILNALIICREPFPIDIYDQVVSHANPQGNIINSDMELAR